jgi:hypothetical protein
MSCRNSIDSRDLSEQTKCPKCKKAIIVAMLCGDGCYYCEQVADYIRDKDSDRSDAK